MQLVIPDAKIRGLSGPMPPVLFSLCNSVEIIVLFLIVPLLAFCALKFLPAK